MKILVLNYEFPPLGGGAAPVSKEIAIQMAKRGHEITVLTMGYDDLPEFEEFDGIEVYRLPCLRKRKNSCMPWEQYSYLLAVKKYFRENIKKKEFDVCHAHFVVPTGEVAKWIKKKYNIPYIITAHGSDVEGHNQKKYLKIMHRVLRPFWREIVSNSCGTIAPSQHLLDLMRKEFQYGYYPQIPNGIDLEYYKNQCSDLNNKEHRILVMGRIQKFKNVQNVLRAFAKIERGDWKLDILGDGPYREEIERLILELNLNNVVYMAGWVDNGTAEQLEYLSRASVYISASQFENCPMSVLEAIASNCYPLLSDISAHRQIVSEDKFFFETNNIDMLALKLESVILQNIMRSEIDVSRYEWNNVIPQYEEVLLQAVKEEENNAKTFVGHY